MWFCHIALIQAEIFKKLVLSLIEMVLKKSKESHDKNERMQTIDPMR